MCLSSSDISFFGNFQCKSAIWLTVLLLPFSLSRPRSSPWWTSFDEAPKDFFHHHWPTYKNSIKIQCSNGFCSSSTPAVDWFIIRFLNPSSVLHWWWGGGWVYFIGDVANLISESAPRKHFLYRPVGTFYTFCERNWTFFLVSSQLLRSFTEGSLIFSLFLL